MENGKSQVFCQCFSLGEKTTFSKIRLIASSIVYHHILRQGIMLSSEAFRKRLCISSRRQKYSPFEWQRIELDFRMYVCYHAASVVLYQHLLIRKVSQIFNREKACEGKGKLFQQSQGHRSMIGLHI